MNDLALMFTACLNIKMFMGVYKQSTRPFNFRHMNSSKLNKLIS